MTAKTAELIERTRKLVPNGTNYAIAKALGLEQGDMPDILSGNQLIGNAACYRLAELLKLDPAYVIATVESERATKKGDQTKAAWWGEQARRIAGKVRRGAAVISFGLAAVFSGISGNSARASAIAEPANCATSVYYVKLKMCGVSSFMSCCRADEFR